MTRPWTVLDEQLSIDERYIRVTKQRVALPQGGCIDDFHLVESPSWAGVVALTEERELILVEQYRHGHQGPSLELPAGVVDPEEEPMAAALRELKEETGYAASHIEFLWKIRPEPARHRQWAHFGYVAAARLAGKPKLDATEDVRVVLRPVSALMQIVDEMVHGVHVGALLLAHSRGLL